MSHLGDILWEYGHSRVGMTVHPVTSALLKLQDEKLEASLNWIAGVFHKAKHWEGDSSAGPAPEFYRRLERAGCGGQGPDGRPQACTESPFFPALLSPLTSSEVPQNILK